MEIITNADFNKKIKENPDGNYLFYGEEDYLKSHAIKSLKDAMGIDEALEIFNSVLSRMQERAKEIAFKEERK